MRKFTRLRLTPLENRCVPAQFGVPWADHQVSVSFAPDGTNIDGVSSNLYQRFGAAPAWKSEVLRAIQAWAEKIDLNVGVVADSGAAEGVAGLAQHDPRFGDIRVLGRPLTSDVLAITVPPGPATGTRGGDIIINTAQPINLGGGTGLFDLYTCMLQETGHAIGMSNSDDANSVMYTWYQSVRSQLDPTDLEHAIALYGSRVNDKFDLLNDNGSFSNATSIATGTVLLASDDPMVAIDAEISKENDADYYSFAIPQNADGVITIRLHTATESLLQGQLSIFKSDQTLLWQSAAINPLDGNLTAAVGNVQAGAKYYVRVDRALGSNVFNVGKYKLEIVFNPSGPATPAGTGGDIADDASSNDTIATASVLNSDLTRPGVFQINALFSQANDVDIYRIPTVADMKTLTLAVRSNTAGLWPVISVVDASSTPLKLQTTYTADGQSVVQTSVSATQPYYVVASRSPYSAAAAGEYHLEANLTTAATDFGVVASGQLTNNSPVIVQSLVLSRSEVMQFVLTPSAANPTNDFGVQADLTDAAGNVVLKFGAASHRAATASKWLAPGTYVVRVGGKVRNAGATLPNMSVTLQALELSDPIGPQVQNPDCPAPWWIGTLPIDWNPWDIDLDILF